MLSLTGGLTDIVCNNYGQMFKGKPQAILSLICSLGKIIYRRCLQGQLHTCTIDSAIQNRNCYSLKLLRVISKPFSYKSTTSNALVYRVNIVFTRYMNNYESLKYIQCKSMCYVSRFTLIFLVFESMCMLSQMPLKNQSSLASSAKRSLRASSSSCSSCSSGP